MKNLGDTILQLNSKYSIEKYKSLGDRERSNFKNELSQVITELKKKHNFKILNDELLFKLAASKANFKTLEVVNQYKQMTDSIKNHRLDQKEISNIKTEQNRIRKDLINQLIGSYALFNAVNDETITINSEMLTQIMQ